MSDDDLLRGYEEFEWEEEPDLTSISSSEIRGLLKELAEEERAISYRRCIIQGRIDLIRAESPGSFSEPLSGRGGAL